jgi:hypothetical protein
MRAAIAESSKGVPALAVIRMDYVPLNEPVDRLLKREPARRSAELAIPRDGGEENRIGRQAAARKHRPVIEVAHDKTQDGETLGRAQRQRCAAATASAAPISELAGNQSDRPTAPAKPARPRCAPCGSDCVPWLHSRTNPSFVEAGNRSCGTAPDECRCSAAFDERSGRYHGHVGGLKRQEIGVAGDDAVGVARDSQCDEVVVVGIAREPRFG